MPRTEFIATGFHVPDRVVSNDDLTIMDTSDEDHPALRDPDAHWCQRRDGASLARQRRCRRSRRPNEGDGSGLYRVCPAPPTTSSRQRLFLQRELGSATSRDRCAQPVLGFVYACRWPMHGSGRPVRRVARGPEVLPRARPDHSGRDTAVRSATARGRILGHRRPGGRALTHLYADGRHARSCGRCAGLAHAPLSAPS